MDKLASPVSAPSIVPRSPGWRWRAVRLLASILLEGLTSLLHFATFPFRRRRERARMAAIIQGPSSVAAMLLGCGILALAAGCQSSRSFPGNSFEHQIDELGNSTLDLIDMRDARGSLSEDLESFADLGPASELLWDLEHLFTVPDARDSITSDLAEFADPEFGALGETIEMFGW